MSEEPVPPPIAAPAVPASIPVSAPAPAAVPAPVVPPVETLISIEDFQKVKLFTAEVISCVPHPKADRLLILQVKIGEKTKQIVSGIRAYYSPEQMVGKTIIVVDNLQPTKLRGEFSYGMLLAVSLPDGGLRLLGPDGPAPSGMRVT